MGSFVCRNKKGATSQRMSRVSSTSTGRSSQLDGSSAFATPRTTHVSLSKRDSDSDSPYGNIFKHAGATTTAVVTSSSSESDTNNAVKIKVENKKKLKPLPVAPRGYRYVVHPGNDAVVNSDNGNVLVSADSSSSEFEKAENIADPDEETEEEQCFQREVSDSQHGISLAQPNVSVASSNGGDTKPLPGSSASKRKTIRDVAASIASAVDLQKQLCDTHGDTCESANDESEHIDSGEESDYEPSAGEDSESSVDVELQEQRNPVRSTHIVKVVPGRRRPIRTMTSVSQDSESSAEIDYEEHRQPMAFRTSAANAVSLTRRFAVAPAWRSRKIVKKREDTQRSSSRKCVKKHRPEPTVNDHGKAVPGASTGPNDSTNASAAIKKAASELEMRRQKVREAEESLKRLEAVVNARTRGPGHTSSDDFMPTPPPTRRLSRSSATKSMKTARQHRKATSVRQEPVKGLARRKLARASVKSRMVTKVRNKSKVAITPPAKTKRSHSAKRRNVFSAPRKRAVTSTSTDQARPPAKVSRRLSLNKRDTRRRVNVGSKIRKWFAGCKSFYAGSVVSVATEVITGNNLYHVQYEDGDSEDMYSSEVEGYLEK